LAACAAGAEVTHLDAVKQMVSIARESMEASELQGIRWVVEDALKFVKREQRRGNTYHGIILDPPAYGRGPEGEKWVLEDQLSEILLACKDLLDLETHFLILNLYSLGFSALVSESLGQSIFAGTQVAITSGELYLEDDIQRPLPLGTFLRVVKD
jgi:23S rRNA (cytosine1962-C5)-methyltransferase